MHGIFCSLNLIDLTSYERQKMINNSRENDFQAKKEGNSADERKLTKGSSSSRPWSGLKDPRVVRVSRSFGGKDRHSKVCTVRGLRDRRVRLSVPTAIQLYDLQDRLGLNQPSKVVDWLLNAAQNEIDELPPLQIPPGIFGQYHHQPLAVSHEDNGLQSSLASLTDANLGFAKDGQSDSLLSSKGGIKITDNGVREKQATGLKPAYWNLNAPSRSKGEEVGGQNMSEKGSWMRRNDQEEENQGGVEVHNSACLPSQSSLSRPNISNSSFQGLLSNVMPFNLYNHWDPSNLSLSQFGGHGYSIQTEDPHNFNVVSMQPPLSLPLLCPSGTTPSFFSPYVTTQLEPNTRQLNSHLQMLNSSSSSQNPIPSSLITTSPYPIGQSMRPLQLSIASRILPSQDNNNSQSDKGGSGPF